MAIRRKTSIRIMLVLVLLVIAALTAFFALAPGIVDRSQNPVADDELPEVSDEAESVHDRTVIVDMHSDSLLWKRDFLARHDNGHMNLPRLEEGNVALQVLSSVSKSPRGQNIDGNDGDSDNITLLSFAQLQPPRTWTSLLQRSLYHAEKLEDAVADSDGRLTMIRTSRDIDDLLEARENGGQVTGAMFSVEGLHNLEGDRDNVQVLFDAGMRMAGFAHFFDNEVADSAHGRGHGGLTDLGRDVVADLEELGVVIDLSHISSESMDEILSIATRPVVVSHGGVRGTCDNNRNLTDSQIRAVADTGGVVGIGYWDTAVCGMTPAAVVDAIEHVISVAGIGSVGLGSDYDGSVEVGWDTSQIAVITDELLSRGHSEEDIAAIMGGNTLRVLQDVLPE